VVSRFISDERAQATITVPAAGNPVTTLLTGEFSREIWQQGLQARWLFLWSSTAIVIALAIVAIAGLEISMLRRIKRISERTSEIGSSGNPSGRVEVRGLDELSRLAESINAMLSQIESTTNAIRE